MSRNTGKSPGTYDDIVRKTVVDPDSSARPTRAQEQVAREGFRALDADEQVLQDRALQALATLGAVAAGVTVEVAREQITLRGRVREAATLRAVEDAVARVSGVDTIHNLVVVDSP